MLRTTTIVAAAVGISGVAASSNAAPVSIVDTTPGSATADGTIQPGEYVGSSNGINSGFGDVIGGNSKLFVDSSLTGALNFGIQSTNTNLNNTANAVVIYIDSVAGGVTGTDSINDTGDEGRRAISGDGNSGQHSDLTFAPTFAADYAISIQASFAGLFKINETGPLTFVRSAGVTPQDTSSGNDREIQIAIADIGVPLGGSFNYFATLLNQTDAFRSNEFQGVAQSTVGADNIGRAPFALAAGDFNTFTVVPEPVAALAGLTLIGSMALRRSRPLTA